MKNHHLNKFRIIFLAILFPLILAGCISEKKYPDAMTVGIAMPTKSIERFSRDGEFLKSKFEEAGYNVELRYSNSDSYQQNNDVECLMADGVDLLIVLPEDGATLSQTLKTADEFDIPVISYDRLIMNTDAIDCYVSFDNYKVGELQGQFVIDALAPDDTDETFNIEFLAGDPADNNAVYFFNGAYDALKPYIESGQMKVLSGKTSFEQCATEGWSTEAAFRNMQNLLASYYSSGEKLNAVVCSNDSVALGAIQALESDYAGDNIPVITGQDGNEVNLKNIIDGKQTMTVYKNVSDEALVTLAVAKAVLSGAEIGEEMQDLFSVDVRFDDHSYNNGKKAVDSFLLTPYIITKDNMDLLVDTGVFEWDEDGKYLKEV